jgi:DUF4097 and DUF4098 domain-containing protein YvlB
MKNLKMKMKIPRSKAARQLLITMTVMAGSLAYAEQQSVDESVNVQADGIVRINVVRGDINVHGWDKDQVEVRGLLDEELEEFIFEVDGDETKIQVRVPRNTRGGWSQKGETELVIRIPQMSKLEFSGVSTDIDIDDVKASVEVGVVSGDVDLDGGMERIVLQTVSGEIELRDATGRIRVRTVSGDVESYNTSGDSSYGSVSGRLVVEDGGKELELETVSGDIEVIRANFLSLSGHSVSGDIDIRGQMMEGGNIDFDNVSGTIRLKLAGEINSKFDLETGSGSIRNRLTDDKPKVSKYVRDERLRFVVGAGDGEVVFSTRSGDINISSN